ncbi:GNAT family N-acetyltransferase [Shouchella lonarensis]|uniref:Ribosomal protein S18 acetylase RimI n=1 Tax=Shouchella lonarensis TaxID=1464122 RepID=A0A1G6GVN6_9BACI|nr:GNAT family N-acetyltransferase [Shouchella lonarensis]SDB86110.1 Ribosomal protein S18 acetylase RimI [Shouchella lonarensis]
MLSSEQKKSIKGLQQTVENVDGIRMKLNWDMLEMERGESEDYFYYEDGVLRGYFAVYSFGNKLECTGMVAPEVRRRGIARQMLADVWQDWGRQTERFLLNAPLDSENGNAFIRAVGGKRAFTEYQLVCKEIPVPSIKPGVKIRPAVEQDEAVIYAFDVEGFEMTTGEVKSMYANTGMTGLYMIEIDGITVGKLRLDRQEKESWIYGFVLTKEKRGQGIGRAALTDVVHREVTNGKEVWLDVAVENEAALSLYRSCGFTMSGAQIYYQLQKETAPV